MAKKDDKVDMTDQQQTLDIDRIKRQLDILDQRLDNIDSMVTAVAERVMNQPLTINLTCPKCGQNIEIAVLGSERPRL